MVNYVTHRSNIIFQTMIFFEFNEIYAWVVKEKGDTMAHIGNPS